MDCDCRQRLLDAAARLLKEADRPRNSRKFITARANAYAASAGFLTHQEHPMTDTLTTVTPEIRRDPRYGRPYVMPLGGGKEITYQRCTTFIKALEDTYNLEQWAKRMVAKGLSVRPDYLLAVATTPLEEKGKLNDLCEQAMEAAKGTAGRTTGSALHTLTEYHDRGMPIPTVPAETVADLDAYIKATAVLTMLHIERGVVLDDLKVHGTPDRVFAYQGRNYIGDVKTGDVEWGINTIAMQLAVYAHGTFYDHINKTREPMVDVDQDKALIIHLPAGQARCDLIWVDIAAGWENAQLAAKVHAARKRKNRSWPFTARFPDLATQINATTTVEELRQLWNANSAVLTDDLKALVMAHKDSLTTTVA